MRLASQTKTSLRRREKPRLKMPFKNFLSGKWLCQLNHRNRMSVFALPLVDFQVWTGGKSINRKYQVLSLFPLPSSSSPTPLPPPPTTLPLPSVVLPGDHGVYNHPSPLFYGYMVGGGGGGHWLWWLHWETVVWTSNIPFIQVYPCTCDGYAFWRIFKLSYNVFLFSVNWTKRELS